MLFLLAHCKFVTGDGGGGSEGKFSMELGGFVDLARLYLDSSNYKIVVFYPFVSPFTFLLFFPFLFFSFLFSQIGTSSMRKNLLSYNKINK